MVRNVSRLLSSSLSARPRWNSGTATACQKRRPPATWEYGMDSTACSMKHHPVHLLLDSMVWSVCPRNPRPVQKARMSMPTTAVATSQRAVHLPSD
jgi:hypothetical protein